MKNTRKALLGGALVVLLVFGLVAPVWSQFCTPYSGLVSRWPGEGNANDIQNGNNGTLQNGATFAAGIVGQAFSFDGVDDFVDIPDSASLDSITSAITVDMWINPQGIPSSNWFFSRRDPLVSEGFSISLLNNGALDLLVRTTTSPTVAGSIFRSVAGVITFDQFQNIAATADTVTGFVKVYVNGEQVALTNTFGPPTLSGSLFNVDHLFIGRRQSSATGEGVGGASHYKGIIDEVSIYNRALTDAEIQGIFNAGGKCNVFLHGSGAIANPPTLFLDGTTTTGSTPKQKDSAGIKFAGGNPWKEIGTWTADPTFFSGSLTTLSDLHVWIGLKNSDDIGTRFDLAAEVWKNGDLVAEGETFCITGVTRNPNLAKEVSVSFGTFPPVSFDGTTDVLSLKVFTRIGTDGAGGFCGGHSNAVGLRLYFDADSRPAQFGARFNPAP
jgi:Concanavalin A-like lectin/glucanases superfamily